MPMPTDLQDDFKDDATDVDDTTDEPEEIEEVDETEEIEETEETEEDPKAPKTAKTDPSPIDSNDDYLADDEPTTPPEVPTPPSNFSNEDKYVLDNLPPINVRVVMADDSVKTLQVKGTGELPRDIKGIATPFEAEQFHQAIGDQLLKATQLRGFYQQNQSTIMTQEFQAKENAAIREDIRELNREGNIPAIKGNPGTKEFNESEGGALINEVIEFMNTKNAQYEAASQSGKAYRRIGFADAFAMMGKVTSSPKNNSARRDAARKLVSKQGATTRTRQKAPVGGRTVQQVAAEFDEYEV